MCERKNSAVMDDRSGCGDGRDGEEGEGGSRRAGTWEFGDLSVGFGREL